MGGTTSTVSSNRPRTFSETSTSEASQTNVVRTRSYSNAAASSNGLGQGSRAISFWPISGIKCPICSKGVLPDDIEVHLVLCLTRPRLHYNEDILTEPKGTEKEPQECIICLEDMRVGDKIARLPCLCIYHKDCIDQWFKVNRICPNHVE